MHAVLQETDAPVAALAEQAAKESGRVVMVYGEVVASAPLGVDRALGFAADSTNAPLVLQEGVVLC